MAGKAKNTAEKKVEATVAETVEVKAETKAAEAPKAETKAAAKTEAPKAEKTAEAPKTAEKKTKAPKAAAKTTKAAKAPKAKAEKTPKTAAKKTTKKAEPTPYEKALKAAADKAKKAKPAFDFAAQITLTGAESGIFYVEAKDGKINVEPYDYKDAQVYVNADCDTFVSVVAGKGDFKKAVNERTISAAADMKYILALVDILF